MKKGMFFYVIIIITISVSSQNLVWWFKVKGEDQWLKIAIPYTIFESLGANKNYLLGYNYPEKEENDVKISENLSLPYILKNGKELKVENVYTGELDESPKSRYALKIKIYNIKDFSYKVVFLEANSISELISKIEFSLTDDQVFTSSLLDLRELKYISLSISKFNSERIKVLEEGLKQFEKSRTLREIYIKSLLEEEEYDKLVEFLHSPVTMKEYRTRIYALMEAEDFDSAKKMLEKIENKNGFDYNNLAICYLKTEKFLSKSKELFLKAFKLKNQDWRIFYNLALFEFKNNEIKRAKEHLINSLLVDFKDFKQLNLLKDISMSLPEEEYGEFSAIDIFNYLIKPTSYYKNDNNLEYIPILFPLVNNKQDEYFLSEGIYFLKKGDYRAAEKLLKRQLYITPFNDKIYFYLSYVKQKIGALKQSLLSIETAFFIKEKLKYLLFHLYIYKTSNQNEKAQKLYLFLKNRYPANTNVEKIYSGEQIDWFE